MAQTNSLLFKVLTGLLAVIPLAIPLCFLGGILYLVKVGKMDAAFEFAFEQHPSVILLINIALSVAPIVPFVYYLVHAARNPHLADRRTTWLLLIIFLEPFVVPIYWYNFIWKESSYVA